MEKIKGTALISRFRYLDAKTTPELKKKVISALSKDFQQDIKNKILISRWYPFRYHIELIKAIDDVVGNGDLQSIIEVGTYLSQYVLKEVYRTFKKDTPKRGMDNIPEMWKQYYVGNGKILLNYIQPNFVLVTGVDFEHGGDEFALAMAGWNKGYLESCGGENIQTALYETKGDVNWGYYISWEE